MNTWWSKVLWLFPIIALMVVFRDAVFSESMYYNGDTLLELYPQFFHFAQGGSNVIHSILSGFPGYVSVKGVWFYPLNQVFLALFDPFNAYRLLILFNLLLAYVFTYVFSRKIGLNSLTSIFSGLVFVFSGQLMMWATTNTNTNYFFLLPLSLYITEWILSSIKNKAYIKTPLLVVVLGAVLGVGWLSGHIQFIVYIHAFVVLYLFWSLAKRINQPFSWKQSLSQVAMVMIPACVLSFIVGFPQIKATLGFNAVTARSGGVVLSEFFTGSYLPQDIIHFFLPFWSNPVISTGAPNLYIGILPVLVLIFSVLVYKKITHPMYRFFMGVYVLSLATAIMYSPIALLVYQIPLINSFRAIVRILFIGNFAAAIAAGFVLEYLVAHLSEVQKEYDQFLRVVKKIFWYVVAPVIAVVSLVKIFFVGQLQAFIKDYFFENIYHRTSGLPQEHYIRIIDQYINQSLDELSIMNWHVVVFMVIGALTYVLLKRLGGLHKQFALGMIVAVTALNMTAVYAFRYNSVTRQEVETVSSAVQYVRDQSGMFRVFSLFPGATEFNELVVRCDTTDASEVLALQQSLLTPNINMLHGIDTIDAYENFMPREYAEVLAYVGSERATVGELLSNDDSSLAERVEVFADRRNILRSMNVRYVFSHEPIEHEDFALVHTDHVGECNTEVRVYELSNTWPRYFVTGNIEVFDGSFDGLVNELQFADEPGTVLVTSDETRGAYSHNEPLIEVSPHQIGDSMEFSINLERPGVLFIGNAWLPGWQATVNGETADILRANYMYMALPLDAGEHEVALEYVL